MAMDLGIDEKDEERDRVRLGRDDDGARGGRRVGGGGDAVRGSRARLCHVGCATVEPRRYKGP